MSPRERLDDVTGRMVAVGAAVSSLRRSAEGETRLNIQRAGAFLAEARSILPPVPDRPAVPIESPDMQAEAVKHGAALDAIASDLSGLRADLPELAADMRRAGGPLASARGHLRAVADGCV